MGLEGVGETREGERPLDAAPSPGALCPGPAWRRVRCSRGVGAPLRPQRGPVSRHLGGWARSGLVPLRRLAAVCGNGAQLGIDASGPCQGNQIYVCLPLGAAVVYA
jgi:hypothetical protein